MGIGKYNIKMDTISQNTGRRVSKSFPVRINPIFQERLEYAPTVDVSTIIPEQIDPRDGAIFKILFKNRNPLNIENLSIQMEGNLIDEYKLTSLSAKARIDTLF